MSVTFGNDRSRQSTSSSSSALSYPSNQQHPQQQSRNSHSGIKNVARKTVRGGSFASSRFEQVRHPSISPTQTNSEHDASNLSSMPGKAHIHASFQTEIFGKFIFFKIIESGKVYNFYSCYHPSSEIS